MRFPRVAHWVFGALLFPNLVLAASTPSYSSYRVGNTSDALPKVQPRGGIALLGGGDKAEDYLPWLFEHAAGHGAGADILVIRASGTDEYNADLMKLARVNSVETIVFHSREASYDSYVLSRFRQAELLFIAGGQQNLYMNYWAGTPVETEIQKMAEHGIPIGGTSAGLAILGDFIYSSYHGSAQSPESLRNPYYKDITLDRGFLKLPFLAQTLTETHFTQRDRMGRFLTFLARAKKDWALASPIYGIAVDEDGALLLETQNENAGVATVAGAEHVYVVSTPVEQPERCTPEAALTYAGYHVQKLYDGAQYDLAHKQLVAGKTEEYQLNIKDGQISSSSGSVY